MIDPNAQNVTDRKESPMSSYDPERQARADEQTHSVPQVGGSTPYQGWSPTPDDQPYASGDGWGQQPYGQDAQQSWGQPPSSGHDQQYQSYDPSAYGHQTQYPQQSYPAAPAPQGYAGQPPMPGYGHMPEPTNGNAVASLVLGVANLACGLTFIPGIICGFIGLSAAKKSPTRNGYGMAVAGLIINFVSFAFLILLFMLVVLGVWTTDFSQIDGGTSL